MKKLILRLLALAGAALLAYVLVGAWNWMAYRMADRRTEQDAITFGARTMVRTGILPEELNESSGVAVSRTHPGVLWSHNDSGSPPVLHAIGLDGELIASIDVQGAGNRDWEDLTLGPCPPGAGVAGDCLYIGDIGDNLARRDHVVVYAVAEPSPEDAYAQVLARLDLTYPEGPADAEALAIDARGDLTIVTKGRAGPMRMLLVPATAWESGETRSAVALNRGLVDIEPDFRLGRQATGAAVSPSGQRLAVRTYRDVYFLERSGDAWAASGTRCFLWNRDPQGEAIDFLDEETLVVTSETVRSRKGAIHRVRCGDERPE